VVPEYELVGPKHLNLGVVMEEELEIEDSMDQWTMAVLLGKEP
jgi:hypothetical protein